MQIRACHPAGRPQGGLNGAGHFKPWARDASRAVGLAPRPRALLPRSPAQRATGRGSSRRAAGLLVAARAAFSSADDLGFLLGQPSGDYFFTKEYDFLVVGSGIAGLSYALKVAEYGRVALITKADVRDGCTQYAQGGVCAVLDAIDCVENHVRDTMAAGAWLNDPKAVDVVCREGPARVLELTQLGADFTRNPDGSLHLTREGGHSNKRIVHAADMTGAEIERALVATARDNPAIDLYEHHFGIDLVVDEVEGVRYCLGMDVLDQKDNTLMRFVAPVTMLASGGAGQLYPVTTNPRVTTGDGIAMAYRAKAAVANMEFVQFHPTALYTPPDSTGAATAAADGRAFLITEAVRGEGGRLYNSAGERFMERYDNRLELATRDVVARSIHDQLLTRGDDHVLLDISHEPKAKVLKHFPNIAARCAAEGVDITTDPIPVVPAQHYFCGGVRTGLLGETSLAGLYAAGEVASTGLHGANRLASNSLLEGLVFAHRAVGPAVVHAEYARKAVACALRSAAAPGGGNASRGGGSGARLSPQAKDWVAAKRTEVRRLMWEHAGIVRSRAGLKQAFGRLATLYLETKAMAEAYGASTQLQELHNLVTVGELVVSSALQRKESRGGHYCIDYPLESDEQRREVVIAQSLRRRTDLARVAADVRLPPAFAPAAVRSARRLRTAARELSVRSAKEA